MRESTIYSPCLQITKIFSKKKSGITYSYKQSFPLSSMQVFLFETSRKSTKKEKEINGVMAYLR